jgi:undecaprenyl diphosphate synthase
MAAVSADQTTQSPVPNHVAIIMDGNGRWARRRALPRASGHKAGIKPVRAAVEYCATRGVGQLTLFAFSSENWKRPPAEVRGLMRLFLEALDREVDELAANGIRLAFIGDRGKLSAALDDATRRAERRTERNTRMQLTIAVAYGGRWDIVQAARKLAREVAIGALDPSAIDEARFAGALETAKLPPVDLLIRTGGEQRISNFLIWDTAYSELYFSDLLWPAFDTTELERAFAFYAQRQRRFGKTGEQVEAATC